MTADAVFDTGASITLIDKSFADTHTELITEAGVTTGTDASGTRLETPLVELAASSILGHTFAPTPAVIVDLSPANATITRPMNLILGWPLLSQVDWIIDHRGGQAEAAINS